MQSRRWDWVNILLIAYYILFAGWLSHTLTRVHYEKNYEIENSRDTTITLTRNGEYIREMDGVEYWDRLFAQYYYPQSENY